MTKILDGNFENVFSNVKYGFKKYLPAHPPREFFHVYIINKSYGFFLFSLKLICNCEFFKKLTRANEFQIKFETVGMITYTNIDDNKELQQKASYC